MKKSVLAVALVLGVGLVVTCCFDKEETTQKVEPSKDATSSVAVQVKIQQKMLPLMLKMWHQTKKILHQIK